MSEILSNPMNLWPLLLAYVIGATPFGLIIGKMRGVDIREHGSGNIGATNVLRTLGKPAGIFCLILDILKGMVPVLIARHFFPDNSLLHIFTAIAAILGHNYTFWLKFKGGKGIATTAGAMAPVIPIPLLVAIIAWIVFLLVTRYVSVASIAAAVAIPVTIFVQQFLIEERLNLPILIFGCFLCVMAVWRHRSNIARLRSGEENRFDAKKKK